MNGRIILIAIVLLAVGVLILPSTVSLFAGQHYWYNINKSGNQIPCEKCHADVFEELNQSISKSRYHDFNNNHKADREDCAACHRANTSITYASDNSTTWQAGRQAHAASVVACMLCHEWNPQNINSTEVGSVPAAGGFNVSTSLSPYDYGTNNGTYAAHNAFIAEAIKNSTLQDSNEACIACHTHVAVKIKWEHKRALEFNVSLGTSITTSTGTHNWTITEWNLNGTATAIVWGNTTGNGTTTYGNIVWPGNVSGVNYKYQ